MGSAATPGLCSFALQREARESEARAVSAEKAATTAEEAAHAAETAAQAAASAAQEAEAIAREDERLARESEAAARAAESDANEKKAAATVILQLVFFTAFVPWTPNETKKCSKMKTVASNILRAHPHPIYCGHVNYPDFRNHHTPSGRCAKATVPERELLQ